MASKSWHADACGITNSGVNDWSSYPPLSNSPSETKVKLFNQVLFLKGVCWDGRLTIVIRFFSEQVENAPQKKTKKLR